MAATLKEIAEKAGVSIRTVTRALKGEPGGNEETCRRVRELADSLGYVPNMAARNLRISRRNIVGIINNDNAVDVSVRKNISLQKMLEKENIYPLSGLLPDTLEKTRNMLREWAGFVNIVVFFAWKRDWDIHKVIGKLNLAALFVDCVNAPVDQLRIDIDRAAGIQEGVERLIKSGRRRIAHVGATMENRVIGFRNAFKALERSTEDATIIETGKNNFEDGYQIGKTLLDRKIDAVFFDTDRMALGFLKFAYENGVNIPEDITVIGFDDDPAGVYSCPSLSSVAHPIDEISRTIVNVIKNGGFGNKVGKNPKSSVSAKTVTNQLTYAGGGNKQIILPTHFIERESSQTI